MPIRSWYQLNKSSAQPIGTGLRRCRTKTTPVMIKQNLKAALTENFAEDIKLIYRRITRKRLLPNYKSDTTVYTTHPVWTTVQQMVIDSPSVAGPVDVHRVHSSVPSERQRFHFSDLLRISCNSPLVSSACPSVRQSFKHENFYRVLP